MSDETPADVTQASPMTCIFVQPPKRIDLKVTFEHGVDWKGNDGIFSFFPRLAILAREDPRLAALMNEYTIDIRQKGNPTVGAPDLIFWPLTEGRGT